MMKISYVLPVFNSQNTINQCLKSILSQEISPYEIIVINDASTDFTRDILTHHEEALSKSNGFTTYNKDGKTRSQRCIIDNFARKGAAYCRNIGNLMATGEIIAVCDADIYDSKRSSAISEFFEKNPDKSIFYSGLDLKDADKPWERDYMGAFEWDFNSKCPISHPTIAYRKSVANEIKYHEDSIETDLYEFFLLDAHKKGYLFGGCQDPLMEKIEGNTNRNKEEAKKLKQKKYEDYGIKVAL